MKSKNAVTWRKIEDRKTEGGVGEGGKPGLVKWIWMLVKGSQTVRIKENQ